MWKVPGNFLARLTFSLKQEGEHLEQGMSDTSPNASVEAGNIHHHTW
jgi:hypothetical protein